MARRNHRRLNTKGKIFFGSIAIVAIVLVALVVFNFILPMLNENKDTSNNKQETNTTDKESTNNESNNSNTNNNTGRDDENSSKPNNQTKPNDNSGNNTDEPSNEGIRLNGLFNTFGGYTSAIVANGGLNTGEDSYYGKAGLDVTIGIEDNDDIIVQSFIDGDIDFFFMTVNKMPIVCKKFADNGIDIVIPYFSDTSTGGDGIVAKSEFPSMESLKNAHIAMAKNSVSTAIPLWFLNRTDLDEATINTIVSNFKMYDSTQEAVEAFVRGEADAVSTWDMTGALSAENSQILFSTKEGENLVIDALVIRKDLATSQPEAVEALIDGCIAVTNDVQNGINVTESYDIIRASVPDFADYDDETMTEVLSDSKWLGYERNMDVFEIASGIYTDFSNVWEQLGEETAPEYVSSLFDDRYIKTLSTKWANDNAGDIGSVAGNKDDIIDKEALISKTAHIEFAPDKGDKFREGYEEKNRAILDDFIETAKILNRMIISVEGNISLAPGEEATEFGKSLSYLRAQYIKDYMVEHGIEEERIVAIGNGGDKPIADNTTEEGRAQNRYVLLSIYNTNNGY